MKRFTLTTICIWSLLVSAAEMPVLVQARQHFTHSHGKARSRGTRIAFVFRGKLYTQKAAGGPARPATTTEKSVWQVAMNRSAMATVSPDGRYEAQGTGQNDFDKPRFHIVRVRDGAEVLGPEGLYDQENGASGSRLIFDGWLPDSRSIALWSLGHIAGDDRASRYVENIFTRRLVRFDGWISPSGMVAIVPDKERIAAYEDERHDRPTSHGYERYWVHTSPKLYAVMLHGGLSAYHFQSSRRVRLFYNGKSFEGPATIGDYSSPTTHPRAVDFSANDGWAICHGLGAEYGASVDYLVSMATGAVRKVHGSDTRFLSSWEYRKR